MTFRTPARVLAGLAVAAALAGCGPAQQVVQAQAEAPDPAPSLGPCEMFVGKPYVIGRDPECGLTDAEKEARHEAAWEAQWKRYREWLASDYVRTVDPRSLPQVETLADPAVGYGSLAESVAHADLAVLGTVEKTTFVESGADTVFRVERTAKGDPAEILTIHQWPTIQPAYSEPTGPDYGHGELTINHEGPMLFAGDRAVLLLEKADDGSGRLFIQNFTGHYQTEHRRVQALPGNAFRAEVDGLTEQQLMDRIAAL